MKKVYEITLHVAAFRSILSPPTRTHIMNTDRKDILLRAAYDLIKRADEADTVLSTTAIDVFYDDANCDGHSLMWDIADELGIDYETPPIPMSEED